MNKLPLILSIALLLLGVFPTSASASQAGGFGGILLPCNGVAHIHYRTAVGAFMYVNCLVDISDGAFNAFVYEEEVGGKTTLKHVATVHKDTTQTESLDIPMLEWKTGGLTVSSSEKIHLATHLAPNLSSRTLYVPVIHKGR